MIKNILLSVIGFILIVLFFSTWFTVAPGERAFVVTFGSIGNEVYDSGFHFKNPLAERVTMSVQTKKIEVIATAASKDLQNVTAKVAVNYNIIPSAVRDIKKNFGDEDTIEMRLIQPSIQDSIKAATAMFTAEELITKRLAVSDDMVKNIKSKVEKQGVQISSVNIMDFNFSESFNQAIESKVTAEQEAQKAKNNLSRIEFEGKQLVVQATAQKEAAIAKAQAEAESIRIQSEAIKQNGGQEYVELKRIEKWDGKLPTQMIPNSTVPFLNVK